MSEWTVSVNEHGGFPRWERSTDEAFERATWQFEGTLCGAIEALLAKPARLSVGAMTLANRPGGPTSNGRLEADVPDLQRLQRPLESTHTGRNRS